MNRREIKKAQLELKQILSREPKPDGNPPDDQKEQLRKLARRVGASIRSTSERNGKIGGRPALISEIIDNIHTALQTHSMIDACRTAGRNFLIAVIAAVAAWAAVAVTWWCGR